MVGFLQAQNCSNFPASWRHPESAGDFMTQDYYRRIAHILEEGKFHLAFFDDRLAMPDRFGDDFVASASAAYWGPGMSPDFGRAAATAFRKSPSADP